ncbi:MAG: histidinol dehydrogenase, partial [Polynucleobacter sp.]
MNSSSASVKVRRLTTRDHGFEKTLLSSLSIPSADDHAIDQVVLGILERIEREGDAALLQYTQQFDRLAVNQVRDLEIASSDLAAAYQALPQDQASALRAAAERVRAYHERQKVETGCHSWEYTESNGTRLGQKITPLDRVGIYVPGGKA